MNTSTIMDMIRDDSTIPDNIPAFVKRVNEKLFNQTVSTVQTVVTEEKVVSLAELNGGECTEQDVQYAIKLLANEPIQNEAKERFAKVQAAISSGEVKTIEEATAKFGESTK